MNPKAINNIIFLLAAVIIMMQACKQDKEEFGKSDAIKADKMVEILCDLYISDGLLNLPDVRTAYAEKDSTENYQDVIASHGYTKDHFDKSINYYFVNEPKKIKEIYDEVIEKLSVMESELIQITQKGAPHRRNLWTGKPNYSLPEDGITNTVGFQAETDGIGTYILKARITVYEDDQSFDPHIVVYFLGNKDSEDRKAIYWDRVDLEKTGKSEIITLRKELTDSTFTHIEGMLFNHTDQPGHWEKHAIVNNITLVKEVSKDTEEDARDIERGPIE